MTKWKLVPVEPTPEMFAAGCAAWGVNEIYDAMLAAAPSPAWVKTGERLPTREDADEQERLRVSDGPSVEERHYSGAFRWDYWMPKPRQQPPEPPEGE